MAPRAYAVLAGSIAVGKTATTQCIADSVADCLALVETRDERLDLFYEDPKSFAFTNQLGYTLQFLEKAAIIANSDARVAVGDRSLYDTHDVFSRWRYQEGTLATHEFALLERAYHIGKLLVKPTALVLLEADIDVAWNRMQQRAEYAERRVTVAYLRDLDRAYRNWYESFSDCPKIRLRTDDTGIDEIAQRVIDFAFASLK